jgi:hypothetical protein
MPILRIELSNVGADSTYAVFWMLIAYPFGFNLWKVAQMEGKAALVRHFCGTNTDAYKRWSGPGENE